MTLSSYGCKDVIRGTCPKKFALKSNNYCLLYCFFIIFIV